MLKSLGVNNSLKEKNTTESHILRFPILFPPKTKSSQFLAASITCNSNAFFPPSPMRLLKALSLKIQFDLLLSTTYYSSW